METNESAASEIETGVKLAALGGVNEKLFVACALWSASVEIERLRRVEHMKNIGGKKRKAEKSDETADC